MLIEIITYVFELKLVYDNLHVCILFIYNRKTISRLYYTNKFTDWSECTQIVENCTKERVSEFH